MKFSSACIISITLILSILSINPNPTSAHFFPNTSAIPSYLIKNTTIWDSFINLVDSKKGQKIEGLSKLKKYFHYFGYINNSYSDFSNDFDDSLASAVKTYQLNFNLNATGRLDTSTLEVILQPRCGNPDIVNGTSTMRSGGGDSAAGGSNFTFHTVAHYSFFPGNPRWPARKSQLTYAFLPENQLSDAVKSVFTRAFLRWSEVTPLVFFETSSFDEADVKIGFFSGDHGDGEPFDGVLGTLAHAFSPPAGLFHLDGDENWVLDGGFLNGSPETAVDLESVAVHEIGHILGLGHSSVKEAMMYPTISSGTRKVELANDDVVGIQELYGSNPNYNGSVSHFTPTGQRDTSRASKMDYPLWRVGLLSTLLLFV